MYQFVNPNPKGNFTGDCVVRAISLGTDKEWDDVYLGLTAFGFDMKDMPSSNNVWGYYLHDAGFTRHNIPDICPNCVTIGDLVNNTSGEYILGTGTHVVWVKDNTYFDTWDSGNEIPIFYWKR